MVLSKRLQRTIRRRTREKIRNQIKAKLEESKNIKHIPRFKTRVRSHFIATMMDKHGQIQTSRRSIANIFATFYEELYSKHHVEEMHEDTGQVNSDRVPAFTDNELVKALKALKNGKCKDTAGVRAEMLKNTGYSTFLKIKFRSTKVLEGFCEVLEGFRKIL